MLLILVASSGKFRQVSNFMELHALAQAVLLPIYDWFILVAKEKDATLMHRWIA